jgi:hypothetical protein
MRNKELAHLADFGTDLLKPRIRTLFSFARGTITVWEHLANAAGVVSLSVASQMPTYAKSADVFWQHWKV